VNGNTVTLKVGGQEVDIPVGQTQPANGLSATVQEITMTRTWFGSPPASTVIDP
jgi:hypothetical protein